jgi:hypothetical protein
MDGAKRYPSIAIHGSMVSQRAQPIPRASGETHKALFLCLLSISRTHRPEFPAAPSAAIDEAHGLADCGSGPVPLCRPRPLGIADRAGFVDSRIDRPKEPVSIELF